MQIAICGAFGVEWYYTDSSGRIVAHYVEYE